MAHLISQRLVPFFLLLASIGLSGCVGAPVQEMSNARQAIRAARDAGALQKEPQKLTEAQVLLDRAEGNLHKRSYRDARRDAIAARDKAAEALDAMQLTSHTDPGG